MFSKQTKLNYQQLTPSETLKNEILSMSETTPYASRKRRSFNPYLSLFLITCGFAILISWQLLSTKPTELWANGERVTKNAVSLQNESSFSEFQQDIQPASMLRSASVPDSLIFSFTLKTKEKTRIIATSGELYLKETMADVTPATTFNQKTIFLWSLKNVSEHTSQQLKIQTKNKTQLYLLTYDEETQTWLLKQKK